MEFQQVIRARRNLRGFRSDPIPDDMLHRILTAGQMAPTAANLQPFHLIVVTDSEVRSRMKEVYDRDWFYTAPVIVVGCAEPAHAWQRADGFNAAAMDLAIVMDHLILAAVAEGLGACWVCAFQEDKAREVLGVPSDVRVLAMTPIGYPNASPRPFVRKTLEDLVHKERW